MSELQVWGIGGCGQKDVVMGIPSVLGPWKGKLVNVDPLKNEGQLQPMVPLLPSHFHSQKLPVPTVVVPLCQG